jgi:hypothetical protein
MAELIAGTFQPLVLKEAADTVTVSGTTFRFGLSKRNGLLTSVRILGEEWLTGARPVPDLWLSPEVDPRGKTWQAARETRAEVRVVSSRPEQIVISASGRYLQERGSAFPLTYHLTYRVDCDGVVEVAVHNQGAGRGELRWLVFSAGAVKRELVDFYSHLEDLAFAETTGAWVTEELGQSAAQPRQLYGGRFVPWVQLGNDRSGLDLTVAEGEEISHGWTDSMPKADPLGTPGQNFVLEADRRSVRWTYFAVRNLYTPVRKGWSRRNRFWLAPVPAKRYHPALSDLRVHWMGPHQIDPAFRYPTEEEIAGLARQGINLVIGGAHWRSGDYSHPDKPREVRRVIAACHRHGLRIIPYLTFTDMDHPLPAFQAHGQDWQIEPVAEYRHLTNLMCYGAEGWRKHWQRELDTVLERFDFDGLYLDFWVGKMACRNPRHGCGLKYPRFTLPGLREMAWHAFSAVKAKSPDHFLLSNTNLFAGALINNLVDIRLPGEWSNIEETPVALTRGHLNSRRLGCNSLLLTGSIPKLSLRSVSFSLRCQSPMVIGHGKPPLKVGERPYGPVPEGILMRYADYLRFFGLARATFPGAWQAGDDLRWTAPDWHPYWCRNENGILLVVANLSARPSQGRIEVARPRRVGISPATRYLVYRPERERLATEGPVPGRQLRRLDLELRAYQPALLFLTPAKDRPQPLWATLSDGIERARYREGRLSFTVRSAEGVRSRVAVYVGNSRAKECAQGGRPVALQRRGALAFVEVEANAPVTITFG